MKLVYILENNKCNGCNLTIHPVFLGYHKCGYANCPICKNAITNSQYWPHIRSHPRHENDNSIKKDLRTENTLILGMLVILVIVNSRTTINFRKNALLYVRKLNLLCCRSSSLLSQLHQSYARYIR
jgi:hypothetical protein